MSCALLVFGFCDFQTMIFKKLYFKSDYQNSDQSSHPYDHFFSSYLKIEVRFMEMGALKPHNNFKYKFFFFHQAQKYPKVI